MTKLMVVLCRSSISFLTLIQYLIYIQTHQKMSQSEPQTHPAHTEAKPTNRWTNISSDEDESESQHEEPQVKSEVVPQQQATQQTHETKEQRQEIKKKEAHIVPFDAKKKFRGGDFAHLKTVKGGFKAEKLEKKKFHLDTVRNPFAFDQDSSDSEEENQEEEVAAVPVSEQPVEQVESSQKKQKKTKKQQEKEELEALLKEFGQQEDAPKDDAEKKKKKKKAKKADEQVKPEEKAETAQVAEQSKPAEQFAVNKQALEELMRKKAEAAKTSNKKSGKTSIASAAKKAIGEREAKNKAKKVYVDL